MRRPSLLLFDVHDTILDPSPLLRRVAEAVGEPASEWLTHTLHASLVANEIGWYRPFHDIASESLLALASDRGVEMDPEVAEEVVAAAYDQPLHRGAYNALERLFDSGLGLVTLANDDSARANTQVENAGLHVFLQRVFSVEEVGLFKPAAETYLHVASQMGVEVGDVMMVSAREWDCAGAMACGGRAAWVRRRGDVWNPPGRGPELVVADMTALADALT